MSFELDKTIFDNNPVNNLDDLTPDEIILPEQSDELTFPELHWDSQPLQRSVDLLQYDNTISKQEMDVVRDYLSNKITMNLEDALPDTMDDDTIITYVKSFGKVYSAVNKASDILQPIVGRLMVLMEKRPEILKHFNVSSLSEFAKTTAPKMFRVARSDAFDAKKIATGFPTITPEQYASCGRSKLKAIGKLGGWNPDSQVIKDYTQVLANNPNITHSALLDRMAEDGHDISDISMTRIDLRVSQSERKAWESFVKNPHVIAHVGTPNQVAILFAMIQECYSEWVAVGHQLQKQQEMDELEPED